MRREICAAITVLSAIAATAAPARASTHRIAVVVGNNAGSAEHAPLHYAEADAVKFARVLVELGGVAPDELFLLQGKSAAVLGDVFARVRTRVAALRADPLTRIVVLFYFSGHSDGEALELGTDRLTFGELRQWLTSAGADVRVALVDSCKSGALLSAKGGKPGAGFQIRLTDELASAGEVLLTSSAADEVALESREIAGSFFTHHFVSGLRGAADASGDGLVTLNEAYQYAYAHTIKTTGETVLGTQHPAYDYRLSGQGELVLAELAKRSATLDLPGGFDRIIVIDLARDQVIAEVTADTHVAIAVQPGRYGIRASRGGAMFAGAVAVAVDGRRAVRGDELSAAAAASTAAKGGAIDRAAAPVRPGGAIAVAAGASPGVADSVGAVPGLRAVWVGSGGGSVAAEVASRSVGALRESSAMVLAGYRRARPIREGMLWAGGELGAGGVMQSAASTGYSTVAALGGVAGAAIDLWRGAAVTVEGALRAEVLKRDGKTAFVAVPAVWVGLAIWR